MSPATGRGRARGRTARSRQTLTDARRARALGGAGAGVGARGRYERRAIPPYRSATISAMIASAVSAGVPTAEVQPDRPAQARQVGLPRPRPRAGAPAVRPASSATRWRRRSGTRGAGPRRSRARRPSCRGSGPRPRPPAPGRSRRPTSSSQPTTSRVDIGEALPRGERRPGVDHHGRIAELTGEAHERDRDLAGTDDHQARRHGVALHEVLPIGDLDRPRPTATEELAGRPDDGDVGLRRARGAGQAAVLGHTSWQGGGASPTPGSCRRESGPGASAGSGMTTATPPGPAAAASDLRPQRTAPRGRRSRPRRPARRPRPAGR